MAPNQVVAVNQVVAFMGIAASRRRMTTQHAKMPPLYAHCRFVTCWIVALTPRPDGSGVLPDAVVAELVDALA